MIDTNKYSLIDTLLMFSPHTSLGYTQIHSWPSLPTILLSIYQSWFVQVNTVLQCIFSPTITVHVQALLLWSAQPLCPLVHVANGQWAGRGPPPTTHTWPCASISISSQCGPMLAYQLSNQGKAKDYIILYNLI